MKANKAITTYRHLRTQPLWRLLAANNGPIIIGLLQTHLYETERSLPASIFFERIERDIEGLRAQGEDLPLTAQAYISSWLADGYLERRFPANAAEEEYGLSITTIEAIRFLSNIIQPHFTATESRLALVIEALARLAEDTDTDKFRRIDRLMAEQARIDKQINAIHKGQIRVLSHITALERIREIITLADELTSDFLRVRDQFEHLNRNLKERILANNDSRSVVLDSLFAGIDLIADSEAGRTFSAFWRLLTNPEQVAIIEQAIDAIMSREFVAQLDAKERRFLRKLMRTLLEQGGMVHEVMQTFARSLKSFVQSREYLEQRRLNQILKDAQRAALSIKDEIKANEFTYSLILTSSRLRSLAQWVLYDPTLQALPEHMTNGDTLSIDLASVSELVFQSEIDFRALKIDILTMLKQHTQVSIAEILLQFPARQGLGSVVGLLALGSRHGYKVEHSESVTWISEDAQQRSARIPKIFFVRDKAHELA